MQTQPEASKSKQQQAKQAKASESKQKQAKASKSKQKQPKQPKASESKSSTCHQQLTKLGACVCGWMDVCMFCFFPKGPTNGLSLSLCRCRRELGGACQPTNLSASGSEAFPKVLRNDMPVRQPVTRQAMPPSEELRNRQDQEDFSQNGRTKSFENIPKVSKK